MGDNLPPIILDLIARLANPNTHRQERVNIYNTLSSINSEIDKVLEGYERETGGFKNRKNSNQKKS